MRGGERVSLLNSCPLTSFYKGRGRALINKHALSFGPVVNYFSISPRDGLEVRINNKTAVKASECV